MFYLHCSYFAPPPSQCCNHVTAWTKPFQLRLGVAGVWLYNDEKCVSFIKGSTGLCSRTSDLQKCLKPHVFDCSLTMLYQIKKLIHFIKPRSPDLYSGLGPTPPRVKVLGTRLYFIVIFCLVYTFIFVFFSHLVQLFTLCYILSNNLFNFINPVARAFFRKINYF